MLWAVFFGPRAGEEVVAVSLGFEPDEGRLDAEAEVVAGEVEIVLAEGSSSDASLVDFRFRARDGYRLAVALAVLACVGRLGVIEVCCCCCRWLGIVASMT